MADVRELSIADILNDPNAVRQIKSGEAKLAGKNEGWLSPLGIGEEEGLLGTGFLGDNGRAATERATKAQQEATDKALDVQERIYQQQREDLEPWRQAGVTSLGELAGMMPETSRAFTMEDFEADPGYQFRLAEGQRAIQNAASARGGRTSSRTLRDLVGFNQGMASSEYQNAYNRFNADQAKRYNQYSNMAGLGQTSVGQLVGAAGQYGTNVGNLYSNMGNAIAGANIAQANMQSNMTGSLLGLGGMALGGYLSNPNTFGKPSTPGTGNKLV